MRIDFCDLKVGMILDLEYTRYAGWATEGIIEGIGDGWMVVRLDECCVWFDNRPGLGNPDYYEVMNQEA